MRSVSVSTDGIKRGKVVAWCPKSKDMDYRERVSESLWSYVGKVMRHRKRNNRKVEQWNGLQCRFFITISQVWNNLWNTHKLWFRACSNSTVWGGDLRASSVKSHKDRDLGTFEGWYMERSSVMKYIRSQQSHSSLRLGKPNYTKLKCFTAKGTSQSDL